uniref:PAAR domain-containing protein n=1 Tax=Halomonas sp. TaxID=1486246 RepID=UPI00262CCBED|nr:PAAR domain-containing protein [Halomonas sp.]
MFSPGDGVILVGDATTHGGRVISGQPNYQVNGKAVAVVGDMVSCPKKGHGVCPIIEGHPTITVNGKAVAFHGCHTGCGAQLISSSANMHSLGD